MRLLCSGQRRLNDTLLVLSVARYSRTGIATMPKLITPRQIERGIQHLTAASSRQDPRPRAFPARPSRAIVACGSRQCVRRAATTETHDAEDPVERRRVTVAVPAQGPVIRRAEDQRE